MVKDLTESTTEIEINFGGFSKSYSDTKALLSDPLLPDVLHKFEWQVHAKEAEIRLVCSETDLVKINGDEQIVRRKSADLETFFSKHNSNFLKILRSLTVWLLIGMAGVVLLVAGAPNSNQSPPTPSHPIYLVAGGIVIAIAFAGGWSGNNFGGQNHRASLVMKEGKRFWAAETVLILVVGVAATILGSLLFAYL